MYHYNNVIIATFVASHRVDINVYIVSSLLVVLAWTAWPGHLQGQLEKKARMGKPKVNFVTGSIYICICDNDFPL